MADLAPTTVNRDRAIHSLTGNCAACGSSTTKTCSGCADASLVVGLDKTFYCGHDCQKTGWAAHKKTCKDLKARKPLYQAGDLLRKLWLVYRPNIIIVDVEKVEVQDRVITFWESVGETAYAERPFAHHLFSDDRIKESVLSAGACGDATFNMRRFVLDMLHGMCDEMEEITVKIKNPLRIVRDFRRFADDPTYREIACNRCQLDSMGNAVFENNGGTPDWQHQVFRVRLRATKEYFVIDLTNAQYGRYDSVIPWNDYLEERVNVVKELGPLGTYDESKIGGLKDESGTCYSTENNIRYLDLVQFYQARMRFELTKWRAENNLDYNSLLELNKAGFDEKSQQLADHISSALAGLREAAFRSGDYAMNWRTTSDPEECGKIRTQHLKFLASHKIASRAAELKNWW
ncbi:hypothetical protein H2200_004865 [Cladophialophora chaetospira]|uniref:MYND-type domain-containing protein n=1 Tax=Cladophialophora chaetospira TaxID=386627 RepID=A0AA38XDW7_9EURO|nr:hypothetical protein H2200_004865 [Cladophialophora chaetospira]